MRALLLALFLAAAAAAGSAAAEAEGAFAVVGDTVISAADYEAALKSAARRKFYHRQVPEAQLREFQREVADMLIERVLLVAEAKRRLLAPDHSRISTVVAQYEKRHGPVPGLARELEDSDLIEQLQAAVRAVEAPTDAQLRAYYDEHPELFVEPERARLSVILLKVAPASPGAEWERARAEAQAMRASIEAGADFAELARRRSGDPTASAGGDMGYLHRGMIPEPLYAQLDAMQPGQLSEPIRLLEGIALFKLAERVAAQAQGFDEARTRTAQLWRRSQGELRWKALIASLRGGASIRVDVARYPALSGMAP